MQYTLDYQASREADYAAKNGSPSLFFFMQVASKDQYTSAMK